MYYANWDEHGAYIDVPDDDNDYVTVMKNGTDGYKYRISGAVVEQLYKLEQLIQETAYPTDIEKLEKRLKDLLEHEEKMDLFYMTRDERREMQQDFEHALYLFDKVDELEKEIFGEVKDCVVRGE